MDEFDDFVRDSAHAVSAMANLDSDILGPIAGATPDWTPPCWMEKNDKAGPDPMKAFATTRVAFSACKRAPGTLTPPKQARGKAVKGFISNGPRGPCGRI